MKKRPLGQAGTHHLERTEKATSQKQTEEARPRKQAKAAEVRAEVAARSKRVAKRGLRESIRHLPNQM